MKIENGINPDYIMFIGRTVEEMKKVRHDLEQGTMNGLTVMPTSLFEELVPSDRKLIGVIVSEGILKVTDANEDL